MTYILGLICAALFLAVIGLSYENESKDEEISRLREENENIRNNCVTHETLRKVIEEKDNRIKELLSRE